jgi:hypothetical protein
MSFSFPSLWAGFPLAVILAWPWLGAGCAGFSVGAEAEAGGGEEPQFVLDRADALAIGRKIWQNECGGTVDGLTSWNRGEDFASLGIGHFIWYPKGKDGPFEESWPPLVSFLRARGKEVPAWVLETPDCPWDTLQAFEAARGTAKMNALRSFLASTMEEQTEFIVRRLRASLPKMKQAVPEGDRARLERNFRTLAETRTGLYALIDYVNFKGEGTKPEERYAGQGWGLAQVLLEMEGEPAADVAPAAFGQAAARVLTRRVANAPRDERMWLVGWKNRCATYGQPF